MSLYQWLQPYLPYLALWCLFSMFLSVVVARTVFGRWERAERRRAYERSESPASDTEAPK